MSRLSLLVLFSFGLNVRAASTALNRYECLRELMTIADRASFQAKRNGYDTPFLAQDKYIVFPETGAGRVTGFFVYDNTQGRYYDAIQPEAAMNKPLEIGELQADSGQGVLALTAQPNGLETVTIFFLPGFAPHATDKDGPVVLGSSVLPVVGALVSRPQQRRLTYYDPSKSTEIEVSTWMKAHTSGRMPSANGPSTVKRTVIKLLTLHPKQEGQIDLPLDTELKVRREWVQSHNLDESSFKRLSRALSGVCAQGNY